MSIGSLSSRPLHGPGAGVLRRGERTSSLPVVPALALLIVAAAALRFIGIGHQGFWYDEANTAQLVRFSPGKMLGLIPQSESTPPLYYCIAWVWARVFGDTEAGLRSLSALAGVLVVPIAYGAGARLFSRRAGLIVAALTATSPLLIWYSQEARSYELLVLFSSLSLLGFVVARENPTPRSCALWTVSAVLTLATHYFGVIVVAPQALWLLIEHRRRRPVQVVVGIVALCGLALIPLAISQNGTGNDKWISTAAFMPRLAQILPQFLIGTDLPDRQLFKYIALALALVALALLALAATLRERQAARVVGALALAGFGLSLLLIVAGFDDLITRNIIVLWLPAALVLGGGLSAWRGRWLGAAVTVALCAIGVFAAVSVASTARYQRPDWRPVARLLGTAAPPADRVILVQHYSYLLPLSLYLPALHVMRAPARVGEIDVISMASPQQPLCWWGAACNLIPSEMQRRYDIPGFHAVSRTHVRQFTILKLVAGRPVRLTRHDVSRALHSTTLHHDELILQTR